MRIGYEAKRVFLNMTGLGNYGRGVVQSMSANYPDNQYFLYTTKVNTGSRADHIRKNTKLIVKTPGSGQFKSLWRSKFVVNDLKKDGIELYHGLSHEIPFGIHKTGIKSVVTIHDLIFKHYPQYFGFFSKLIYSAKINYACKHSDMIIAMSEKTKSDLVELLKVDAKKIEVIYQCCDDIFYKSFTDINKGEIRLKYTLPENYILSVGTIEERKNLMLLMRALSRLPKDTELVVIGKATSAYAKTVKKYITKHNLGKRIRFLTKAAFVDLPVIYQMAQVFVYPSRYEGFGIPVLEALVSGTPVIAATGSCLEEAGGPDSIYVSPDDPNGLAEQIERILSNTELQQTMAQKGRDYAKKFESKKLTAQLMQLYTNVVNNA